MTCSNAFAYAGLFGKTLRNTMLDKSLHIKLTVLGNRIDIPIGKPMRFHRLTNRISCIIDRCMFWAKPSARLTQSQQACIIVLLCAPQYTFMYICQADILYISNALLSMLSDAFLSRSCFV